MKGRTMKTIGKKIIVSLLVLLVAGVSGGLVKFMYGATKEDNDTSMQNNEPMETVRTVEANTVEHCETKTAIGTVVALRSITLKNELAGTVKQVKFKSGDVVEANSVLISLDTSVEQADLNALEAQASLAKTTLHRMKIANQACAVSEIEIDKAAAEYDIALAQIARIKAIIGQKTIRTPFRARVGLVDVHPGQYLHAGTKITSLVAIEESVYVDFSVNQKVIEILREGQSVDILTKSVVEKNTAKIVAIDSNVNKITRNAMVRAKIDNRGINLLPGSSVHIQVPIDEPQRIVVIPVNALRKGPGGDYVFIIAADGKGKNRAHHRKVESGRIFGDDVEIRSGISKGERVASAGSFKLREKVLVAIANNSTDDNNRK